MYNVKGMGYNYRGQTAGFHGHHSKETPTPQIHMALQCGHCLIYLAKHHSHFEVQGSSIS